MNDMFQKLFTDWRIQKYEPISSAKASFSNYRRKMEAAIKKPLYDDNVARVLKKSGVNVKDIPFRPRNLYDPDKLYETLGKFRDSGVPMHILNDGHMKKAISVTKNILMNTERRKLNPMLEIRSNWKRDKSAGLPTLLHKEDLDDRLEARVRRIVYEDAVPNPCIAYKRTQAGGKTRLVWGYPAEMTYLEFKYADPLIRYFMMINTPITTGFSKMNLGVKMAHSEFKKYKVALDYSKFDSTVPRFLIHEAFKIIRSYYPKTPIIKKELDIIERYFIFTPIVMPDGNIYFGKNRGVPSGSNFTQLVDSIVNVIVTTYCCLRNNIEIDLRHLYVLGDDVQFFTNTQVSERTMEKFAKTVEGLKMVINDKKSRLGETHFLGADWKCALRHRSVKELLEKLVYPETYRKYSQSNAETEAKYVILATLADCMQGVELVAGLVSDRKPKYGIRNDIFRMNDLGRLSPTVLGRGYMRYLFEYYRKKEVDTFRTGVVSAYSS